MRTLNIRQLYKRHRGAVNAWVLILIAAVASLVVVLTNVGSSSTNAASQTMINTNLINSVLADMSDFQAGYTAVMTNGTAATQVSLNGLTATADIQPSVTYGPVCLSATGTFTATVTDCASVRTSAISNYTSQIFSTDPAAGSAIPHVPNQNLVASKQDYIFTALRITDQPGNDLGTSSPDQVSVLKDVKLGVCIQLNNKMWGDSQVSTAIPASGLANLAAIAQGATIITTATGVSGPRDKSNCVSTTDGKYFIYQVMVSQ